MNTSTHRIDRLVFTKAERFSVSVTNRKHILKNECDKIVRDKPILFIVDDCAAYRVLISIMLKKKGYEVRSFESAKSVLSVLETNIPDMIISDLEMPYMDGLDFFQVLKKLGYIYKAIPFVIISSIENESRIEEVHRVSKRPLIKKSIPMSAIIEKIGEILENPVVSIMNDSLKKSTH